MSSGFHIAISTLTTRSTNEKLISIQYENEFDPVFCSSIQYRVFLKFDPSSSWFRSNQFSRSVCIVISIQIFPQVWSVFCSLRSDRFFLGPFASSIRSKLSIQFSPISIKSNSFVRLDPDFVRSDPNFLFVSIRCFLFDPCLVILTKLKVTQE